MDELRNLRKLNQVNNKPKPLGSADAQGGIGERDRNTGKRRTRLDNKGTYQANQLFNASPGQDQRVQLDPATQTADYSSAEILAKRDRAAKVERLRAVGVARPEIEEETDAEENDPDNPIFGNCNVCSGKVATRIDCGTGEAIIRFGDGSQQRIETPAEIRYGGLVEFNYTSGGSGQFFVDKCVTPSLTNGSEDPQEPYDAKVYGQLIYQFQASSFLMSGVGASGLKQVYLYKDPAFCRVTVVATDTSNNRSVVGILSCDELEGTYVILEDSFCIEAGAQKACGIDPGSIGYSCAIQGDRLCQKYFVRWVVASTGEETSFEDCEQLGYAITTTEQDPRGYTPGPRDVGTGFLRYDSGIPRTFTVNGVDSGEYGYFQIYQSVDNPCLYEVVGVKISGAMDYYSGAVTNLDYQAFYTGGCGFEVILGDPISTQLLRLYDAKGDVIQEINDFVPESVEGCPYDPDTGLFTGSCQLATVERIPVFQKTVPTTTEGGVGVQSIECVV